MYQSTLPSTPDHISKRKFQAYWQGDKVIDSPRHQPEMSEQRQGREDFHMWGYVLRKLE